MAQMRPLVLPLIVFASFAGVACDGGPGTASAQQADMVSITDVPPKPAALDPPPVLQDEAPPPKPKALPWETPTPIIFTPDDDRVRASLPFTPAIAMDPVDGDKISIRATTPTFEYKGRIYYFSSAENLQKFKANPDSYLTGKFTKL
jgi:YHS domain-containing protein